MKRLLLVPALGLAALSLTAPAHAQSSGWLDQYRPSYADQRLSYYDARRVAYDTGYREGLKEGGKDARNRETYRFEDEKTWQRADKGYRREYGDVERYRQAFRAGYSDGYTESYRYDNYGPAYDNGARDGYEKGQEDARKGRSYDPLRHDWYRSADRNYDNRYGTKDAYRDVYRDGFKAGYVRGYRGGYR